MLLILQAPLFIPKLKVWRQPIQVNLQDHNGSTCLHEAAKVNSVQSIEILLHAGKLLKRY